MHSPASISSPKRSKTKEQRSQLNDHLSNNTSTLSPSQLLGLNSTSIPSSLGLSNISRLPGQESSLDMKDFPSLSNRAAPNPLPTGRNYGVISKGSCEPSQEFHIQQEDFPALPGLPASSGVSDATSMLSNAENAMKTSLLSENSYDIGMLSKMSVHSDSGHAPSATSGHTLSVSGGIVSLSSIGDAAASLATPGGGGGDAPSLSLLDGANCVAGTGGGATSGESLDAAATAANDSKTGIQTHSDGLITNIPMGMVGDQFGIVGLLTFIRAAETDRTPVALAPGIDLTTLGLNLHSSEPSYNLYSTFQSPWAEYPCRTQDIDYHVPCEYLTNKDIGSKLSPIKLNQYGEDLLFFLFYMNGGDVLQLAAATELFDRDWRFHRNQRSWLTRASTDALKIKTNTYERGMYYFFDATNWIKIPKEFHLEYDQLEERPQLPAPPQSGVDPSTQSM